MSEFTDAYRAQMPEKCQDCMVFTAILHSAEMFASHHTNMATALVNTEQKEDILFTHETWSKVYQSLIDIAVNGEFENVEMLDRMTGSDPACPGLKRGGVPNETFTSRILSWVANEKSCQNPGLYDL